MRRRRPRWAVVAAAAGAALAAVAGPASAAAPPADSCSAYLPAAERQFDIPPGLLTAIALTESGVGGQPYPWALNLAGQPRLAEDQAAAARLLRDRYGLPRQDMAVGCMQIHMRYHLASVGAPEWVLEPRNNVRYAAAFLRRLFDRYGSWRQAIGHYNASDPGAQQVYLCQVARSLGRVAPTTAAMLALPQDCASTLRFAAAGTMRPAGRVLSNGIVLYGYSTTVPVAAAEPPLRPAGGRLIRLIRPGHVAAGQIVIIRGSQRSVVVAPAHRGGAF